MIYTIKSSWNWNRQNTGNLKLTITIETKEKLLIYWNWIPLHCDGHFLLLVHQGPNRRENDCLRNYNFFSRNARMKHRTTRTDSDAQAQVLVVVLLRPTHHPHGDDKRGRCSAGEDKLLCDNISRMDWNWIELVGWMDGVDGMPLWSSASSLVVFLKQQHLHFFYYLPVIRWLLNDQKKKQTEWLKLSKADGEKELSSFSSLSVPLREWEKWPP